MFLDECRAAWRAARPHDANEPEPRLETLGVEVARPDQPDGVGGGVRLDSGFLQAVRRLACASAEAFGNPERIFHPKGLDGRRDPALRLADPLGLPGLEEIAQRLACHVESEVYGCFAEIDKVHVYRQVPFDGSPPEGGSWHWHVDGHPTEYVKALVYLTDVLDDAASRFEFLWSERLGMALKGRSRPMDERNWFAHAARYGLVVPDAVLADRIARGYAITPLLGPVGSTCLFSTNCVHRATVGRRRIRDSLILRFRPTLEPAPQLLTPAATLTHTSGQLRHAGLL